MQRGLVVGKFYPLHEGHKHLVRSAIERVGESGLTIMIVQRPDENPHGRLREKWMQMAFPNCEVKLIDDIYNDDDSAAWAKYTIDLLGKAPDVVFTSEEYGHTWAQELGCDHQLVDIKRKTYPVSGTKVRNDAFKYWKYIDGNVRAHYVKKICVLGAESTGTTTLSRALAKRFNTLWVPEFGRFYTEGKLTGSDISAEWYSQEFEFIAHTQNAMEDQYAKYANKYLICDTDSFATAVWHERYMGDWDERLERLFSDRDYDLYVLTDVDIPFVQDGMRDGEHIRKKMHNRFIELLEYYEKPYVIASGSVERRVEAVLGAI